MSWHFLGMLRLFSLGVLLLGPLAAVLLAPLAPDCAWRHSLGIACPGCGLGHALTSLGQGRLMLACQAYPPLPALVLLWLLLVIGLAGRWKNLVPALPWAATASLLLVLGNWFWALAH